MNEPFLFLGIGSHFSVLIIHSILAMVLTLVTAKIATKNLQMTPKGCQNVMESVIEGILHIGSDVIPRELARKYLPLTGALALYIFFANMIGIIPGFESPTSNVNLTLVLALIVFFYYHYEGIKKNGVVHYFSHFAGPVKMLAPLMFPIEIISHISRIISLSFRLFGNIKGDDLFLAVLLMLAPWIVPLPAFALLTFSALLQAFIFMILTYVYLAGAVTLEEEAL
jgi:F-type H+-transporting ATPase subunit a